MTAPERAVNPQDAPTQAEIEKAATLVMRSCAALLEVLAEIDESKANSMQSFDPADSTSLVLETAWRIREARISREGCSRSHQATP